MARKYEISKEKIDELQSVQKNTRDKNVDRRLRVLILHTEGQMGRKISEITGYNEKYLYALYRKYLTKGFESITGKHYGGNHRNMTYEEESEFLAQFIDEADGGRITDVSTIKTAYDEKIGHDTGHGQIYWHGWTKKLPRRRHPKSAGPEAIETSKKLTPKSAN